MKYNYRITAYRPEEEDDIDFDKNDIVRYFNKRESLLKFIVIMTLSGRKHFVEYKDEESTEKVDVYDLYP